MITVEPITVKAALKLVKLWHRHLPDLQGGLFAATVVRDGEVIGVGIAGNPSRVWQGTARLVISRCALDENRPPTPHVNRDGEQHFADGSAAKLYGSLCAAAKALGYREAWTYTLPNEPGSSLRAAGFVDMGVSACGEHDRPNLANRRRKPARHPEPKRRWRRLLRGTP